MKSQRYKFYGALLMLLAMNLLCASCGSTRIAQSRDTEREIRTTVESYILAMNQENIKTLEDLYAEDFKSYAPLHKVSKKQLLTQLQNGFNQQDHQIRAKITEISSGTSVATAHLQWMIMAENQEILFAQNLLQVWKKEPTGWKLHRILFYSPAEVLKLEDFNF